MVPIPPLIGHRDRLETLAGCVNPAERLEMLRVAASAVRESLGDFPQDATISADPIGTRPGSAPGATPKMDQKSKMLAEIERRREALLDQVTLPIGDEILLRRQLDGVEQALYAGRLPDEEWEQHQFHWMAHCAEQERSLILRSSHLMLTFEDMERHEPDVFLGDETVMELLHWWREDGGREDYLGQLTIAERRELEEQERQWREKRP